MPTRHHFDVSLEAPSGEKGSDMFITLDLAHALMDERTRSHRQPSQQRPRHLV